MTTARKLWLGFGTLTALLVLSSVALIVRVLSIETDRAPSEAALQDAQAVVGFALIVLIVGAVIAVVTSVIVGRGIVKAEALVRQNRELLRVTLASIGDAVITTDTKGRVTYLNAVAESLTGWTRKEAEGRPVETVFHIVNASTRKPVESLAKEALREGTIVGPANHTVLIARDGRERPIDDSAAPIQDEQGQVAGVVHTFRDITERRRAEDVLTISEIRYRRLFESARDGVLILDAGTAEITDANPFIGELLGYSHGELMGKELWEIGLFKDQAESKAAVRELQEKKYIRYEDLPLETKPGRRVDVEFVSNVYIEDHHPVIQCNIRDITERKRLDNELRRYAADLSESDLRKNEFLAMLAHELRNPLAPICNALQIMRLTGGNGEAAEMLDRQVGQMVRLVDDLLDVSRISQGKIELRKGRIELASVVHHAVEAARPLIASMGQELTVTLPPEAIYLDADPTRLAQVVGNLLNNACKYTEKGGRILLTVEREDEQAVIAVRDSGIGIAADQLPLIFDMFTQVLGSRGRSQSGLGIGLTLVRRLVEMHDGTVEAHSAGVGHGSEFVVRLPAMIVTPQPPAPEPADHEPSPPTGLRILVVDDNRDSATSLATLLELTGNETHTAHDGLEAVDAASSFRPDVVLLDIGLPKMNGYEAARKIREQPWGKTMVLVALTGWGQEEDRRESHDAGFNVHMVKPVDYAALKAVLAELQPSVGAG